MSSEGATRTGGRRGRRLRIAVTCLALCGCVVSGVLAALSAPNVAAPTVFGARLCGATDTIDCDHVLRSKWSKVGPISTPHLGIVYFLLIAGWFALVGPPNRAGRHWHLVPMVLVAAGLCGSLLFVNVMARHLAYWCTWCLAAHGINGAIFVLTLLAWPRGAADGAPAYPSGVRVLGVLGGSGALSVIILLGLFTWAVRVQLAECADRYTEVINDPVYVQVKMQESPLFEIPVRADDPAFGSAEATHTMVLFSDFSCPHCRLLYRNAPQLAAAFPGRLRIVVKHFPVSRACNPHMRPGGGDSSCRAAAAAEAARVAGTEAQHRAFCRRLFVEGPSSSDRHYVSVAEGAGIDAAAFESAYGSEAGRRRIETDVALGHEIGVSRAGTVFLNGRRMPTWYMLKARTKARTKARLDPGPTVELWERLLGVKAVRPESRPAPGEGAG